jgi:hypothetical protein
VVVIGDKGYDSEEDNHVLIRDILYVFSVIPARYVHVPIWKTHVGRYRKQTNDEVWLFIYLFQTVVWSTKQG